MGMSICPYTGTTNKKHGFSMDYSLVMKRIPGVGEAHFGLDRLGDVRLND
jgi:hypothetical protein